MIDSSPRNTATVLAIFNHALQIADELKLENIAVVFDQAVYAKAQVIHCQHQVFNKRLILRLFFSFLDLANSTHSWLCCHCLAKDLKDVACKTYSSVQIIFFQLHILIIWNIVFYFYYC